ncbi:MAG: 4Fe-4S ferredoxin, partial [Pseudomonadota bacterium]
ATGTGAVAWLFPIHLGTVLAFFLLTPYSKMAHGFYRMAALTRDAARLRSGA